MHDEMDIDTVIGMRQDMKIINRRFFSPRIRIPSLAVFLLATWTSLAGESSWTQLPARTADQPDFSYYPSPGDWRKHTIYQIITDRFYDGDPSNNTANPGGVYNPFSMDSIHGGDFAGITAHLDYIKSLGFDVIWISPVFLNHRGAYHGYHITDFNQIDPHWGTLADLRHLIDQAHARNMYVIIDVVFNHMARLLSSDDPGFPQFSEQPYTMRWSNPGETFAPPFDNLSYFHGHGSIQNWEDDRQNVLGDLQGLADLKTEDAQVRTWLMESHMALMAATDCDGFRIDTAHHVELDFWSQVLPRLHEGATALGKTNFLMFAEALRGRDEDVSKLTREGNYPSALYYPLYFTFQEIWRSRNATRLITERWNNRTMYGPHAMSQLVAFGDNHDRNRLLNAEYLNGDINRLKALLTMLYACPSIPCIYYGTEQGFSGSKGHQAREPMFNPTIEGIPDHFSLNHELAQFIHQLNAVRRHYPALIHGDVNVIHDENTAGLFVFNRISREQTVTIILNNSTEEKSFALEGDWINALSGIPYSGTVPSDSTFILVSSSQFKSLSPTPADYQKPERHSNTTNLPFASFRPDGRLDEIAILVASNDQVSLYAAYNPESKMMYLATTPANSSQDRFIMIAFSNHQHSIIAPWHKKGEVPAYDILISNEGESDFTSIRGIRNIHWSNCAKEGVFEAAFLVPELAALDSPLLYVRTESFGTEDQGPRVSSGSLPESGSTNRYVPLDLNRLTKLP